MGAELDPAGQGDRSSTSPAMGARPRRLGGAALDLAGQAMGVELDPAVQAMASFGESRGAEDAAKRMKASGAWGKSAAARLADKRRMRRGSGRWARDVMPSGSDLANLPSQERGIAKEIPSRGG